MCVDKNVEELEGEEITEVTTTEYENSILKIFKQNYEKGTLNTLQVGRMLRTRDIMTVEQTI